MVDASEPAFWKDGCPPEWARPGFFEDYFEREPAAREAFWRCVRDNYPETSDERRIGRAG